MARNGKTDKPAPTAKLLDGRLMLRVAEFSALTGTPKPSVYKYIASGQVKAIRIGGSLRIPVSAIQDLLNVAAA